MKRYLLDSNALNLFAYRRRGVFEKAIQVRRTGAVVGSGIPVAAEILAGARVGSSWEKNFPIIERTVSSIKLWPFDLAAAHEYAAIHAELKAEGIAMQVIDKMIAAIVRTIPTCVVVTSDGGFSRVTGIHVENWAV